MFRYIILIEQKPKYIDTCIQIPHVECYHIKDNNEFWVEEICGREYLLGHIDTATNSLDELQFILGEAFIPSEIERSL